MESKSNINESHSGLELISKFEFLEEIPNNKPVLLCNIVGEILFANSAINMLYRLKEGDNLFDLDSEPKFSNLIENLSKKQVSYFYGDLLIQTDEEYFKAFLVNLEKVTINKEELFIVYLDSHDKRNNLSKKFNIYNRALEYVNVGVMIADQNANIKYISTSFEKLFDIKIEDVYDKSLIRSFQKYLSENETAELELAITNHCNWTKVISNISKKGDVYYKEIRLNVIKDNIDKSISFIITVNDITKHIQQARIIKKSEQRQKSIINNISDPIIILRKEKGELVFENANNHFYSQILETLTSNNHESILEIDIPLLYPIIKSAIMHLEGKDRIHSQFHYTSPNKNKRFLGKVSFIYDQYDNTRLYIVNMTDITEQLEIEGKLRDAYKKEISLNKLKSTFLANMSHEIRTPLNAIVGYSDLLEDDMRLMNCESSSMLTSHLKEGVNRLLKLVDNIVEVSLLESGNEDVKFDNVHLNKLIENNKNDWIDQAALRNITIQFNLSTSELIIYGNEEKLERAIKEIVDNAIKYNYDEGKISISTVLEEKEIKLHVSDTGIGIEKDSINKIFHLFEQEEEVSYTRKYEGAGLGLSLANKLVSFMNGNLNIVSQPNEGTIITISFPKI